MPMYFFTPDNILEKMRYIVAAILILMGTGLVVHDVLAADLEWQVVTSSKGGFTVKMPGTPQTYTEAKHTKIGIIGEEFYRYEDEGVALTVEYSDLPDLINMFGGKHEVYKKIVEDFLSGDDHKEVSLAETAVAGEKGKMLIYETPTRDGKALMVLVKRRLYVVHASMVKGANGKSAMDDFISSFKPL